MADRPAPRVLIFEPVVGGHHLQYVRTLAAALHDVGAEVTLTMGRDARRSDEFRVHLQGLDRPRIRLVTDIADGASRGSAGSMFASSLVELRRLVKEHRPDRVYLPYADGLIQVLGVSAALGSLFLPSVPIEALIMRGSFAYPAARLQRPVRHQVLYSMLARSPVSRLHVLDALVYSDIVRRGGRLAQIASPIPEPVEPVPSCAREEARARLGVPQAGRYVVCAGALDSRKGVDILLRAAVHAQLPEDARLLLVGRLSSDLRSVHEHLARQLGSRLITIDRYVTEEDFGLAIAAADVVAVPYPAHQGSSGLLVRALAAGRPLLASDYGWVGWITQTLAAGLVADVSDLQSLVSALTKSLDIARDYKLSPLARRFISYHTSENQGAHWTRGLRESLGQNGDVPVTWSEVVRPTSDLQTTRLDGVTRRPSS